MRKPSCVYFAQMIGYPILKVGVSTSLDVRMTMLTFQARQDFGIFGAKFVCLATVKGGLRCERAHQSNLATDRLFREWFHLTPSVYEYIFNLPRETGPYPLPATVSDCQWRDEWWM